MFLKRVEGARWWWWWWWWWWCVCVCVCVCGASSLHPLSLLYIQLCRIKMNTISANFLLFHKSVAVLLRHLSSQDMSIRAATEQHFDPPCLC